MAFFRKHFCHAFVPCFTHFVLNINYLRMPFYAVKRGRQSGVFKTWRMKMTTGERTFLLHRCMTRHSKSIIAQFPVYDLTPHHQPECQAQVHQFLNPKFKKFVTETEAWAFVNDRTPDKDFKDAKPFNAFPVKGSGSPSKPPPVYKQTTMEATPAPVPAPVPVAVAAPTGPTRISSTRLLALEGTVKSMKVLVGQLNAYMTTAEEQLEAIQRGKKRPRGDTAATASLEVQSDLTPPARKKLHMQREDYADGDNAGTSSSSGAVSVYTDGCCHGNGKKNSRAGIGVFWGEGSARNVAERLPGRQTNNRAEIHAVCKAVRQAKEYGITNLVVHTDSQFLINGITKWIHKWKQNGWRLASGGMVINKDDFEELDELISDGSVSVTWVHVDAHVGIPGNEAADQLANQGATLEYVE